MLSGLNTMRRHGWQRPLHPLQLVGMAVYCFFVVTFYTFLGLFLGNRIAEITVTSVFSFVAISVIFLFVRCTAIDPTDRTSRRKKKKGLNGFLKLNYGFIMAQLVLRYFKRMERRILRTFIRKKYLEPWKSDIQLQPLIPFPLVNKDDTNAADPKEDDISFCVLCDFQVKKRSKHCRTCNRCVDGFDHHCRWLNNCIGKKNYTVFFLLMVFLLLMFIIEGGTAVAIFVRCFTDKHGIEAELRKRLYVEFPRGVLAAISALLFLMTAYSSAALGQLFLFHVVLIRKGMRTYDYILAMKEANESLEMNLFSDSDYSSDDNSDFDSPEKPTFVSRLICRGGQGIIQSPTRLSIRIDKDLEPNNATKNPSYRASIDPWTLIKMSREKAIAAAEKARERLMGQKPAMDYDPLKPLPLETKTGPLLSPDMSMSNAGTGATPLISKGRPAGSPGGWLSSPRRRFSSSPTTLAAMRASPKKKYKSNFDLKLTEVSRELEGYISRQVLCSALKKDATEASPR